MDIIVVDGMSCFCFVDIVSVVKKIYEMGCLVMVDCLNLEEGLYCKEFGFDIIGSMMLGYIGGEVFEELDY